MTREQVTAVLVQNADRLRGMGITGLYMFGSRARGDNRADSDLDLFVDYSTADRVPSFFDLLELRLRIEDGLGIPVHLGTRASLDPAIRREVEHDAVRLF